MKSQRQSLAGLQARARAGAARHAENRVVVSRDVAPAADSEGGTATGPVSAELWLYGTVGGYWWGFDSDDVAAALRGLGDVDEILVRLHSFGGSAIEGIAIANLLANHPATIRIVVDGVAASAASMIALAGAELVMSPGSQLMVHDAWMMTAGNEAELLRDAAWIGKQSRNYAETYAHRAGGTAESWRDTMRANGGDGTWYSAQEAVDAGLADRVENIASTTPPPPMPDPADLDDDLDLAAAAEWDFEVLLHPAARATWSSWRRYPGAPQPPSASAVGSIHTEGGSVVSLSDQAVTTLRTKLGVAGDADEATILAALDEALDERAEPTPATAAVTPGDVVIPEVRLKDLEAAAASGVAAAKKLHEMERDAFLDQHKSKYPATSRADWAKRYDRDPEGTRELLAGAQDLVPTAELGHSDAPEGDDTPTTLAEVRTDPTYTNWRM